MAPQTELHKAMIGIKRRSSKRGGGLTIALGLVAIALLGWNIALVTRGQTKSVADNEVSHLKNNNTG